VVEGPVFIAPVLRADENRVVGKFVDQHQVARPHQEVDEGDIDQIAADQRHDIADAEKLRQLRFEGAVAAALAANESRGANAASQPVQLGARCLDDIGVLTQTEIVVMRETDKGDAVAFADFPLPVDG
jgi:hypothetical protein